MGISSVGAGQAALLAAVASSARGGPSAVAQSNAVQSPASAAASGTKDGDGDHGQEGVGGKVNVLA